MTARAALAALRPSAGAYVSAGMGPQVRVSAWVLAMIMLTASASHAQCGATLSQCRNCHEVAGARPVLMGGSPWHADHAFGDFCPRCHGGNPEAVDKASAHRGVTSPLAEIDTRCGPCHPGNAAALADTYLRHPPPPRAAARALAAGQPDAGAVPWANVVLAGSELLLGALGAGYVARNERRLRRHAGQRQPPA